MPLILSDYGCGTMLQEPSGSLGAWRTYAVYPGTDTSNQDFRTRKEVIAIPTIATWGRQQHSNVIARLCGLVGMAQGGWEIRAGVGMAVLNLGIQRVLLVGFGKYMYPKRSKLSLH